ncbi:MAG: transglutaminase family protein [Propionicimonas sp.]|uniref:transglutaminase-like domain-containing protein n=1 Tax=Propionicimonas sp. TaxID=1955623 RepID=UPI003D0BAF19
MERHLTCHLELSATGPAELVLSISTAKGVPLSAESLVVTAGGAPVTPEELLEDHGTRLHRLFVDAGPVLVDYAATVAGLAEPAPVTAVDRLRYLRQSRYCEADRLAPTAAAEFAGLTGTALLAAVVEWVNARLTYVSGSSTGTDSALDTLLARQGVCRDFAHLSIALLRALGVPARLAAVYAPGLSPMEFHAVCEALVDDTWWVVDATGLAPRQSLVRVATGRDAADTAFLTSYGASVELVGLEVTAVAEQFALDDQATLTQLR